MINELETIGFTGVRPDTRPTEEKDKDYSHKEFLASGIINWITKTTWTTLDRRFQTTSSSCGGQAGAKAVTAFYAQIMSANLYRLRSNYSGEGMFLQEIGDILKKNGTDLESFSPSQGMLESAMNAVSFPQDNPFKISSYYFLPGGEDIDMDKIAQALTSGHAVVYLINADIAEWTQYPVYAGKESNFSHFVVSVPENYLMYENEKSTVIDDSCNAFSSINGTGQRILRESFLKQRCRAIMALVPITAPAFVKPQHTFRASLYYAKNGTHTDTSMMNNPDVKVLQDILKYEGCMPTDTPSTGNFLEATLAAVKKFQKKYANDILKPIGLTEGTGYVGIRTIDFLNSKYSK